MAQFGGDAPGDLNNYPITQGRVIEYRRDKRKAAFAVLNVIELLEREASHHQLRVPTDWHHCLYDHASRAQNFDARECAVESG